MSVHGPAPTAGAVRSLGGGLHLIDTGLAGFGGTVGVYLQELSDGRFALIEAGAGSTEPAVASALRTVGYGPRDLAAVLVTHVHLDHAGGAGHLSAWSDAPVYVHPRGAKHLADPSRLWSSAARIYGDAMDALWGEMRPIPEERLRQVEDGDAITIGGRRWRALDTPGHAGHHLALLDDDGRLFTGDAAGIRLDGFHLIRPALPPPETDLEAYARSIDEQRAARPDALLLTHFGLIEDADEHLARVPERNRAWAEEVRAGLRAGEDLEALTARLERLEDRELEEAGASPETAERYKATSNARMSAMGLERYWRKLRSDAS